MPALAPMIELGSRIFIALIFVVSGFSKVTGFAGTQQYMEAMGVPGGLLPLVILTELVGGLMIIAGYQTRVVALLLGGFTVISALLFHANFEDQTQMIMFMKNITIAGGFGLLIVNGAGKFSLDYRFSKASA